MSRLFAIGAVFVLLWNASALACDPPTSETVAVGKSSDGKSLLMRTQDTSDGTIELQIMSLKDGTFARTIPIIKADDPKNKRAELRKSRWDAADKELKAQGFVIDAKRFAALWHGGDEMELKDGIKLSANPVYKEGKDEDDPTQMRTDLVLQKGGIKKVAEEGFIAFTTATGTEERERLAGAYYFPEDGTLLLVTGSCSGVNYFVRSLPALMKAAGLTGK